SRRRHTIFSRDWSSDVCSFRSDVTARRTAGVRRPWLGVLRQDVPPVAWSIGVISVLTYLGGWWAWFASETATDRHYVEIQDIGRSEERRVGEGRGTRGSGAAGA